MHARFGHQEAALNVLNEAIMMAQEGTQCALILEKSAISKVQKSIICIFKHGKKSIFAPEKSLKLSKMQFSD